MKQPILFILLLFSFGAITSEGVAQEAYTYVSSDSITVGDRFGVIIVVPRPNNATIARPIFSAPAGASALRFGDLIVFKSLSSGQLPLPDGSEFSFADTLVYEATTFAIDSAFVPPLRLRLVVGSDTSIVSTIGFHFPVVSLVDESMDDILDLSEIAGFPSALWPWFLLAGILLATFLIVKFKDRLVRAPEAIVEEEPEVEPDPPFEEAMKRLDILELTPFVDTEVKEFFVELADIVRLYFSRRIDLPALESTSSELLSDLSNWTKKQHYDQPFSQRLEAILSTADMAKFADSHPAQQLCLDALERSRGLLSEIEDLVITREKNSRTTEALPSDSGDEFSNDNSETKTATDDTSKSVSANDATSEKPLSADGHSSQVLHEDVEKVDVEKMGIANVDVEKLDTEKLDTKESDTRESLYSGVDASEASDDDKYKPKPNDVS